MKARRYGMQQWLVNDTDNVIAFRVWLASIRVSGLVSEQGSGQLCRIKKYGIDHNQNGDVISC